MNSDDWNFAIAVTSQLSRSPSDQLPPAGMVLALGLLTSFAAWATPGALSCDEHFQVFEYARFLMGQVRAGDLAWEFSQRIRPLLQPLSVSWILEAAQFAGLKSPFDQALCLRLVNGLLCAFMVGWLAWVVTAEVATKRRRWVWLTSQGLFFIPILNAHPMSEVWGGVCLAAAISVLISWNGAKNQAPPEGSLASDRQERGICEALLIGALAALSFVFRYQMAFALVGFFLWLAIVSRRSMVFLLVALAAFTIVLGGATLADGILYQQLTFAPWRYFDVNILQGRAADFGVEPFYQYGLWLFTKFPLPFGPLIVTSTVWFVLKRPKHVLSWVLVPFLVLHCILGHKEIRFLYPMAPIVAAMFAVSLAGLVDMPQLSSRNRRRAAITLFLLLNTAAAVESVSMLRPRITHLAEAIKRYPNGFRLFWSGDDPTILCSRRMWGYLPPGSAVAPFAEFSRPSVVFVEYDMGPARPGEQLLAYKCSKMSVGPIEVIQDHGFGARMKREVFDCDAGPIEKGSATP